MDIVIKNLSLLGIPHIIYCINKMDLVDYDQKQYEKIKEELVGFSAKLRTKDFRFIPISALNGDNVVNRSNNMSWYEGSTLLHTLEMSTLLPTIIISIVDFLYNM